ncbi:MAG: molybdopterin-dependent oxidoreductase [Paracoccaceae bacterium]
MKKLTSSHWGIGVATVKDNRIIAIEGHERDPLASEINLNIPSSLHGKARVLRPAIRKSWLDGTPKAVPRGRDSFVEVSWDRALDLVAADFSCIRSDHGNTSIFAGSYGWASAGRFHHAQSQLKRFLNSQGGFVRSEGNYSFNAALGLMPFIVGPYRQHVAQATRWSVIAKHSDLVVMFGGMALRNTQVGDGGISKHRMAGNLKECADAGVEFVNISPLRSDAEDVLKADWMPVQPGTDTALMMGLAHTLLIEGHTEKAFLETYTVGFDAIKSYLLGEEDGQAKDAAWAAEITGLDPLAIQTLARRMAAGRTMISVAAGVQRTDFGEQPLWMAVTLAAMLGQIGLPGGGYTIGYGVNGNVGNVERPFTWGALSQLKNPVEDFLPVAMISDMLLNPGGTYQYLGENRTYPDARLVWWAGGNPFHHHQDLNRLHDAFQTPETVIVNEMNWTATARHADIVLPIAAAQERDDFGAGRSDNALVPMSRLITPPGDARVEYDIFTDLADRLGTADAFSEGKTSDEWLRELWETTLERGQEQGIDLPDWDTFVAGDVIDMPDPRPNQVFLADFRSDPKGAALPTPSGRIELFSDVIAGFGLPDCPGHAHWIAPRDSANDPDKEFPFAMLSGQPKTRLHSQLDNGAYSLSHKIAGREPVLIHPDDAEASDIKDGDVVELFNARGRCLAGAKITDEIVQGCVFLWTGAWYDPDFDAPQARDRHGNPNVLTHDLRTSSLTQSPAAHSAMVQLRKFDGPLPVVEAHTPPPFANDAALEKPARK